MKERLAPSPHASRDVVERANIFISWNAPGHENEYLINLPGLIGHRGEAMIPNSISNDLANRLGDAWELSNRGFRLEVYGMGQRDDQFVVSSLISYFDELAEFERN